MNENPWIPLLELTGTFKVEDLPELGTEQLMARAHKARNDAEKEIRYAQTISEILERKGESPESQKSLVIIGVWHFECAVELFSKAIRNYERARARGLSKNRETEIEIQIRICHDYLTTVAEQKKSARKLLDSAVI
jgi:hypothetical protein